VCTAAFYMNSIRPDIAKIDRIPGGTCDFLEAKTVSSCTGNCVTRFE
jgi:hypothetical protein